MFEQLKKTLDKGIDFASMTSEKIVQAAKDLANENNLTKEEAKKLLDYLQKRSQETRQNMERSMQDFVKTSLHKMDIPTKEEMKKLEERIKKLETAAGKTTARAKKVKPKASPAAKKTGVKPAARK